MQTVAFPELVVGDPLAEMVNRVEGNVSGEPVQHFRQHKVATAVNRPFEVTPAPGTTGVGTPEIVLDKEDTDEHGRGTGHDHGIATHKESQPKPGRHQVPAGNHNNVVSQEVQPLAGCVPVA